MSNINYENAYEEVLIVINNLIEQDYKKIPKEYIDFFEKNSNPNHIFIYDVSKPLSEQNVLDDTKYILFYLFEKFGATETQKGKIDAFKRNYYRKLEEQKRKEYNPDGIFKGRQTNVNTQVSQKPMQLTVKQKWYQIIFSKIFKFIKKNN